MSKPWVDGEVLTAAQLNAIGWGWIGTGIGTGGDITGITTATDITSVTVSWTAPANRRCIVRAQALVSQASSAAQVELMIRDAGGATASAARYQFASGEQNTCWVEELLLTGGGGAVTRKLSVSTTAGSCTVEMDDTRYVARIVVFDIGAA